MSGERAEPVGAEDAEPVAGAADFEAIQGAVQETARGRWFLAEFARRNKVADTATLLEALQRIETAIAKPAAASAAEAMKRMGPSLADALVELRLVLGGPRPGESAQDRLLRAQSQLNMLEHRLHSFIRELGIELPPGRPLSKQPIPVQGNLPAPGTGVRAQPPAAPMVVPSRGSYWASDKPVTPVVPNLPVKSAATTQPPGRHALETLERALVATPVPQVGELRLTTTAAIGQTAPWQAGPVVAAAPLAADAMPAASVPVPVATARFEPAAPAPALATANLAAAPGSLAPNAASTEPGAPAKPRPDPTLRMTTGQKTALFS